jgi:hypothetical protein
MKAQALVGLPEDFIWRQATCEVTGLKSPEKK